MNGKSTRRGFVDSDTREFSGEGLIVLKQAQEEIHWLLDRGYPLMNAVTFAGNHHMLSSRQRLALLRAIAPTDALCRRKAKEVFDASGRTVNIDGFNLIITLEVALSGSTLIKCVDGAIRDLAGLRGTYRLIEKTDAALELIGNKLKDMAVAGAAFCLDESVSNTGRLKARIRELVGGRGYDVSAELIGNVDRLLKSKAYVVTADAIILNECVSWINLAEAIIRESIPGAAYIDLSLNYALI